MDPVLKAEAEALHRALFGRDCPEDMVRRYVEAHSHVLTRVTGEEREWMARAVGSDVEALEFAVRDPLSDHILSRKVKLLVYLAEASPEYYDRFVNEQPGRVSAYCSLAWHGARSVFKFLKGWVLRKARGL